MKDQTKQLTARLKPYISFAKRYLGFIVFILFMLLYTVLVLRINQLSEATPTPSQVSGKQQTIANPKIDPDTLSKIQQLQSQNIQVQALFNQARKNPFSE
jgi:hypothetical protein